MDFSVGSAKTYRLGDYSVSTWQNQFDFGNNYFTIQTYCADYYDPISNTIKYDYKYLSPNDMFFNKTVNSAVKKYNKGATYAY